MLVPLGLWVGIIGYAVLYSGVIKLGGGKCSLAQAFRGQCIPGGSSTQAGTTTKQAAQAAGMAWRRPPGDAAGQQSSGIPSSPVGMA